VIVDDEDYEKKETFQVYLGQPYVVTADGEEPPPSPGGNTPEEERIRELGKPRLGKFTGGTPPPPYTIDDHVSFFFPNLYTFIHYLHLCSPGSKFFPI
jgi:hypothetical protein